MRLPQTVTGLVLVATLCLGSAASVQVLAYEGFDIPVTSSLSATSGAMSFGWNAPWSTGGQSGAEFCSKLCRLRVERAAPPRIYYVARA